MTSKSTLKSSSEVNNTQIEVDDEPEVESEEYTPLSASEDQEKKAAYNDYKLLVKNIKYQNKTLENLKEKIKNIKEKPCLSKSEKNELENLYCNWEREMSKLQELVRRAINLQNIGSQRHYRQFPLVTTFDEDKLDISRRISEWMQDPTNKANTKPEYCKAPVNESSDMNTSFSCKESPMSVCEERKLIKEIAAALKECSNIKECKQRTQKRSTPCEESHSLEKIKSKIKCMQEAIFKLTENLNKKETVNCNHDIKQKPCATPSTATIHPAMLSLHKNIGKAKNFQQLEQNYIYLLTEFNKKDDQLKELTKKLRNTCSKCIAGAGQDAATVDESELHLLRSRINEMQEEQVEFKCLMREQSLQLDEYRNKYLTAQQKVEEQCVLIEKLNMNNKRIEKQINQEVKEIREKFQERLADLLKYPKLLENEQLKLAQTCKEKEELENKLMVVCKELKTLKAKELQKSKDEDCKPLLNKCQEELCQVKKNIEEIQRQRDMFCEQLRTTMEDLNALRSESAKIIARTRERAELIKNQNQEHINCLEKQLAQCRAAASLSVSDRETVIKEMQGQLNTLSYSFDAAQKQIKTLRNHIAYMSNEKSFLAKC